MSPTFRLGNEQHNEDQLFFIGGKGNIFKTNRNINNASKQLMVSEPSQLTNKQETTTQYLKGANGGSLGTKTSSLMGGGGGSSRKQLLIGLPDIIKEISKME
jgi:hypothetical protein